MAAQFALPAEQLSVLVFAPPGLVAVVVAVAGQFAVEVCMSVQGYRSAAVWEWAQNSMPELFPVPYKPADIGSLHIVCRLLCQHMSSQGHILLARLHMAVRKMVPVLESV